MGAEKFKELLKNEISRIDASNTAKRNEVIIEDFSKEEGYAAKAVIKGKKFAIFNSNDYLGFRFNEKLRQAEENSTKKYGTGPGAVRFISGSLQIYKELEQEIANFHGKDDAIIFSSAFAANMAVIHCFAKGQSKDSLIDANTLIISDELNHRSIIDGVRVANLPKENKAIFKHRNMESLKEVLNQNKGKFKRVVIVTDGVFSMLGVHQNIAEMQGLSKEFDNDFEEGVITIVDDAHGIGVLGKTGRGVEELHNSKCGLLVGTLGKAFGSDGGYVTGNIDFINYLRESAATYIYSNCISPGTAAAGLTALKILNSDEGKKLLDSLKQNISTFKSKMIKEGFTFAAESEHAIQPILIGDAVKTRQLVDSLFEKGFIVTNISYPVVPKGRDEIRVQISAIHTIKDIEEFIDAVTESAKQLKII
jgi:glycine C-acetyltransferase